MKLAVDVGGTSRPAAGSADQFVDGNVLDLELKIFEVLRRFQYGLYVNNFTLYLLLEIVLLDSFYSRSCFLSDVQWGGDGPTGNRVSQRP